MVRFVVASAAVAFAFLLSSPAVDASKKKRGRKNGKATTDFTIFERQSDDGPRHSPLFTLPVQGEGEEVVFPSKMVLFNNDLYDSEDDLLNENQADTIGYNQVRR